MQEKPLSNHEQECLDCRTVLSPKAPFCDACGSLDLRTRNRSRFAYDALAVFTGVIVVVLYWVAHV